MPHYTFSVHCDGEHQEDAGTLWLPDDSRACEFGKRVIQDTLEGIETDFEDWTLDIIESKRIIFSMRFAKVFEH